MNLLVILAVAVLVLVLVARRFAGQPLRSRPLVLPLAITGYGLFQLRTMHFGVVDLTFLAIEVVFSVGVGAIRGLTTQLYERAGQLWQRYRWTTLLAWLALIGVRIGLGFAGRAAGVDIVTSSILLVLGLSLVAEALVVQQRVQRRYSPSLV
jgi:hypothetical protein